ENEVLTRGVMRGIVVLGITFLSHTLPRIHLCIIFPFLQSTILFPFPFPIPFLVSIAFTFTLLVYFIPHHRPCCTLLPLPAPCPCPWSCRCPRPHKAPTHIASKPLPAPSPPSPTLPHPSPRCSSFFCSRKLISIFLTLSAAEHGAVGALDKKLRGTIRAAEDNGHAPARAVKLVHPQHLVPAPHKGYV
ncbi:unnamed protein product, partial [Closterium sp. NIES-54]